VQLVVLVVQEQQHQFLVHPLLTLEAVAVGAAQLLELQLLVVVLLLVVLEVLMEPLEQQIAAAVVAVLLMVASAALVVQEL
jgi:hypothetical protein